MQRFLVIQTAFIGDVVLATGILEKLHVYFPDAAVDLLVRKGNEALFTGHPYLHEVLVLEKKRGKIKNLLTMLQRIRRNKYQKVINVQRFFATGLLTALSGAEETIGFDKNPLSFLFSVKVRHVIHAANASHETERNNDLIKAFTDEKVYRPALYPSPQDFMYVAKYKLFPYICIAPSSVWFTKQYPKEKWISFLMKLPPPYHTYLLGAPGDKPLCDEIAGRCPAGAVTNLCGQLNFLQSAALMKDAVMNYVNDSAPLHFASAVNAAVTAVYCSTIPSFGFGPLSDKRFIAEIPGSLYCRPCGLHGHRACPQGHFRCALDISDEQLLSSL